MRSFTGLKEISKYTTSVIIAFFIDLIIFYLLMKILKIHYLYSSIISLIAGFLTNYYLNNTWVFKKRKYKKNKLKEVKIMVLISIIISGLNILGITLLIEITKIRALNSKLIASFITFILKYYLRKKILYSVK